MTQRERQLLEWIEENPLISQQELSLRAGITRSSVAVHISNLMKKGLIQGKGYVVRRKPYLLVVGGANIDISGKPDNALVACDSNPGQVQFLPGGVGRNIAHNLALLGEDARLLTAFGSDTNADRLIESCRSAGIDISPALSLPGERTSTYLFITDEQGEMALAVSDMRIYEQLTPAVLAQKAELVFGAAICVADTNIPAESLAFLAENCRCPLFVDPVSTTKAQKLVGLLDKIHTLKPNLIEAQLLSGIKITDEETLAQAAQRLLSLGLQQVFITLNKDGVYCADRQESFHLPCLPMPVVNTTGAGDSFTAALCWSWQQGFSLRESALAGLAAAGICLGSPSANAPKLSAQSLLACMADNR